MVPYIFSVLAFLALLSPPAHGTITSHTYTLGYDNVAGPVVQLPCGLSITPVVNGSLDIIGQYDDLHRAECGTLGSKVKPFRVRVDIDVAMAITVQGTVPGNTTLCELPSITLACVPVANGLGEICVKGTPKFSFSNTASAAAFGTFTTTMSGSMLMLVGGSVTTNISASGFPDPLLPTNAITTTHTRSWSEAQGESEYFSDSTLTADEGGCQYFYDSRNAGDALSLSAYTRLTTLVAGPSTITLANTTGCSDSQFDAWDCYRYQDASTTGGGTTTTAQVRYPHQEQRWAELGFCDAPPPGGLKTAKSLQCARPLWGAPRPRKKLFSTKTHFLKPQRNIKS